ncbi:hypothetical protein [Oleiharenicola sp. Vm1]|uniref:hypothetical protein n=1 Tax=Oleiharenicola sp. Vm1 TaxID=3398393 RepID=UPI0039F4A361
MNMLEALAILRACALGSAQMQTKRGKAALKVVDKKLQSLLRKKAWRDGGGAVPVHMGDENFTYALPDAALASDAEPADSLWMVKLEAELASIKDAANEAGAGDPPEGYSELTGDAARIADDCWVNGLNAMETAVRNWLHDQRRGAEPSAEDDKPCAPH